MKNRLLYIIGILSAAALAFSCSGNIDTEEEGLVLTTDKTEISADGADVVTFTVSLDGADVTDDAEIFCVNLDSALSGTTFSTASAGSYRFYASYDGETSETVTVTATGSAATYKRNYCIAEFTSQFCTFCPEVSEPLTSYYIPNVFKDETIAVLAFHSNSMGDDIFYIEGIEEMRTYFKHTSLPGLVFDMRETVSDLSFLRDALRTSKDEYPAHCGLSLSSELSQDGASATVKVGLSSSVESAYRVAVFVVEDKITAVQHKPIGADESYSHRHVVRSIESSTWQGDNFGTLAAGETVSIDYSVSLGADWNLENVTVVAVAYDENGYANNVQICAVDGGNKDFEIIEN